MARPPLKRGKYLSSSSKRGKHTTLQLRAWTRHSAFWLLDFVEYSISLKTFTGWFFTLGPNKEGSFLRFVFFVNSIENQKK
jgi:hypothetical protein